MRIERLENFWRPDPATDPLRWPWWSEPADLMRRSMAAGMTAMFGRTGVFAPRRIYGPWWDPSLGTEPDSLYDHRPLAATLDGLVDFERLNRSRPRFSATAVDVETGADMVFDTERTEITSEHIQASSALLPAFAPVEVDGRWLADAGISANLPLDAVLSNPPEGPLLCIALDLLPLPAPRPVSLGDGIARMQDLVFATQSRRAIAAWQAIYDERVARGATKDLPSITLVHLAYADQGDEVSGKAFDFSLASVRARWDAGYRDLAHVLAQFCAGKVETGRPGLAVYRPGKAAGDRLPNLRITRESLAPLPG